MLALGLVSLLAVGGVALVSVPGMSKPIRGFFAPAAIDVIPFEIRRGPLPITVTEKGSLESAKNEVVYNQVEGSTTILMILPEGTKVKKGDLVCELDSATLRESLTNQRISTEGAKAAYEQAKLTREVAEIAVKEYEDGIYGQEKATINGEIKLAESDLARAADRVEWANRMFDKGYVSLAQKKTEELNLQKAQFALEQANSKLKVLDQFTKAKTIKELRSDVEKALSDEKAKEQTYDLEKQKEAKYERQIANCKLFAPGDGLIVYANDPGRNFGSNTPQVEEGASVRERQPIFSLPDITNMQVNAKIHESQLDKIASRMGVGKLKAKIRVDAFADQELDGTVSDVAPLPDPSSFFSSDIKVYTSHIKIDNPLPGLRPGMNAEVVILVDRKEEVLTVPVQAVLEFKGKDHIAVKGPNGYVRKEVTLGATNDKYIEVVGGAEPGQVVALNPIALLSDEEKRELFAVGRGGGAGKQEWAKADVKGEGPAADVPGAPGAGAPGAGAPGAGGPDAAKAKGKGARRGAGGGAFGAMFQNLSEEDRAKMRSGTEAEKAEILKKAGVTPEMIEQMKQMRQNGGGPGGPGGPGGGFGGRGPGGPGGPGGGN